VGNSITVITREINTENRDSWATIHGDFDTTKSVRDTRDRAINNTRDFLANEATASIGAANEGLGGVDARFQVGPE
jgi:hypothetical protein